MLKGQLTSLQDISAFALAGNATITIRSTKTQTRFTFKIRVPKAQRKNPKIWFVSLLSGSDNVGDYCYMGQIRNDAYDHGRKSRITTEAASAKAFSWFWQAVQAQRQDLFDLLEVWHEGRCGRCGRKLTVPSSVSSGFGPECINHVHQGEDS